MRRISFLILASCIGVLSFQTASAQFPVKIKIPKPKPQPTPTETSLPASSNDTQSTLPQPESGKTTKRATAERGVYAKKEIPTNTPRFLTDTLNISCDTQDYYWKSPKETNYTSWIPHLQFYVLYAGSATLRFKAEYFMPDGQPCYSESLEQRGIPDSDPNVLIASGNVSDKDKGKAVVTGGAFGVKITNLRDNSVVFQGKFKVIRYKPENTDARFRNLFDFYVDQDWNLPIGYAYILWDGGAYVAHPDEGWPVVRMWFKGGVKTEDLEVRLFYNGQQLATTDDGGYVNSGERRFPKKAGNNPALMWNLFEFKWFHKIKFIGNANARALTSNRSTLFINQSPGEYTVKVFYKGEQVRETRFSIADGNFADNDLAKQNKISTNKIILPVKVIGNVDKWNAAAWKTDAFYGNPLTGFNAQ